MERLDRFELEGVTYYQQRRKCGKVNCATCRQGQGHGPYWYRRSQESSKVKYLGRDLPAAVTEARQYHAHLLGAMVAERRQLLDRADALSRLIGNRTLKGGDRAILADLGFGACLVSDQELANTQDGE